VDRNHALLTHLLIIKGKINDFINGYLLQNTLDLFLRLHIIANLFLLLEKQVLKYKLLAVAQR
jgi:hypothetical protein